MRRQPVSILRWKWRLSRSDGTGLAGTGGAAATTDASMTGPPAASHSRNRAIASSSEIFAGSHRSGTHGSPGRRSRNSRDRPPLGSSKAGDHHATTCACARVIAT